MEGIMSYPEPLHLKNPDGSAAQCASNTLYQHMCNLPSDKGMRVPDELERMTRHPRQNRSKMHTLGAHLKHLVANVP
jgi:hypothetical protein